MANILNEQDTKTQKTILDYIKQYDNTLSSIPSMLPTGTTPNTFLTGGLNRYNQILGQDYQAISDDELDRMFNQKKTDLYKDTINPNQEKLAAQLAISGQSGGGVAGGRWEDQTYQNKKLLSDAYNEIQDMGFTQTASDKNNALGNASSIYAIETDNQQYPLNAWQKYADLITNGMSSLTGASGMEGATNAANGQASAGIMSAIASFF
jgi:hypothetical protein